MIKIENLNFSYLNKNLFKNLSFETGSGCVGLLGKNGAGKTSLLKIISGQLFFESGKCKVNGYTPFKRNPLMLEDIFFVPEEFILPPITAEKYISLNSKFYPNFDYSLFEKNMKIFNLDKNSRLDLLSHGQKKKFMISYGCSTMTKILLLDEPTNGLDIPSKKEFRAIFTNNFDNFRTIIISTHNVKDVEDLIDPIVILDNGEIIFKSSVKNISEKLMFLHIKDSEFLKNALYFEETKDGYFAAFLNDNDSNNDFFDFEFIFNMVLSEKEKINKIFGE
jgi:ABC-2 type transport system ATP-binding protein